ncbi:MAG TPA: ATP synthase F1 subunit epsilon [bacterium]|jgi:F-type H+-transporting ATPase subunit epsilon|nr:ATP synthase F1 subunit epsilon [Dictyoglomota bacterium]HHV80440.1 ATP synthase F1 subunit epsilon [bacterium]HOK29345.1 ATP synthase F1 subunit epsilon [bacterium]HOL54698.1 ATP synthase F1 subunit epsilon [bacterium]HON72012.1 ATP synthase F1 subunit epsilon [bacterium]
MKLNVRVVTPDRLVYEGEADSVVIPGYDGYFGVLPNHAPMLSMLDMGELKIRDGVQEQYYAIDGGFCEISKNKVIIITPSAQRADEIDDNQVMATLRSARERLHSKAEEKELLDLQITIRKASVLLEVSKHKLRR